MQPRTIRALAAACLVLCLALVLHALVLGFYVEATPRALEDAAKGRAVGYPAGAGAVAAVAALAGAARTWGRVALVLGVLLAALALVVDVTT